ncbi:3-oxoacyl-[acyl-carrier-protein] synthase III C-terminal domain-containing protein [Streptomyces sp. NPDC059832]|uniref:3-oxoacyl-[acyl-carrier-protein] synthase III C-terminal domain-containing protein n=1 Tax=Streptomyces sp. NPDC059832 TaxID=3346966 RepID=UPI00364D0918
MWCWTRRLRPYGATCACPKRACTCRSPDTASIPLALDHAHRSGRLETGEPVMLAGFGGGMTIGTSLIFWGNRRFAPGQQRRKD